MLEFVHHSLPRVVVASPRSTGGILDCPSNATNMYACASPTCHSFAAVLVSHAWLTCVPRVCLVCDTTCLCSDHIISVAGYGEEMVDGVMEKYWIGK